VDLEKQLADLAPATRYFGHQEDRLEADRHTLQPAVAPPLADDLVSRATPWTKQRLIPKTEIKLDRSPQVFCALILVLRTHAKGVPQQSLDHFWSLSSRSLNSNFYDLGTHFPDEPFSCDETIISGGPFLGRGATLCRPGETGAVAWWLAGRRKAIGLPGAAEVRPILGAM
jgi:hypothetical protein